MPLSEHEERILAEIERQLAAEDPRFAARSRRGARARSVSALPRTLRLRLAVGLAVAGVLAVLGLTWSIALAAVGMAMILAAILLGATAVRERLTGAPAPAPSPDDAL